jgi:uncharacterized protein YraI
MREGTRQGDRAPLRTALVLTFILATLWLPRIARADTGLAIGGTAVIAYANGDDVRLRDAPSYSGGIIDLFPEGTVVDVLDGPAGADDGSLWYRVAVGGEHGYMVSDYLASAVGASSGDTSVLEELNLRAGPSTDDAVLAVMPGGSMVTITGDPENGFYPVDYAGTAGWAFGDYLDVASASEGASSSSGTATVTSELNLRSGPSTAETVLAVMPGGAVVTLTGDAENGFLSVDYNGTAGWAFADYLSKGSSPVAAASGSLVVTEDLNLRDGPNTDAAILLVMPAGAFVDVLGDDENGFTPVRYSGRDGWAYSGYLSTGGNQEAGPGSGNTGGSIVWPISGGEWEISQGYNGPYSHWNAGSTYQYYYSFDIARTDGSTAGTPIYSPVNGTITWTEAASGGISINVGNGYAVAMFHVTFDAGLTWGQAVSQGQYLGTISGPGGDGYMGFEHVHISLWQTSDGGNWDRTAAPFTGQFAISGMDFPDIGGGNQYAGTLIYP